MPGSDFVVVDDWVETRVGEGKAFLEQRNDGYNTIGWDYVEGWIECFGVHFVTFFAFGIR